MPNRDFYIMPQLGQQAQKPLHGVVTEIAAPKARYVRLGESQQLRGFDLLVPGLGNDPVDAGNELRLEKMRFGVGMPQICEYVAAAVRDLLFFRLHGALQLCEQ